MGLDFLYHTWYSFWYRDIILVPSAVCSEVTAIGGWLSKLDKLTVHGAIILHYVIGL